MSNKQLAHELMQGAIDVHIHAGPDVFPRLLTDIEVAEQAKQAGMKAVLIKNHITITSDRAQIATDVTGFPVYGGVALNLPLGGLNPQAVEMAIRMNAKEVWMPTIHAEEYLADAGHVPMFQKVLKEGTRGINILDENGKLKAEVYEIIDMVAKADIALATGHISRKESLALVKEAKARGVSRIIITHPVSPMLNYTNDDLAEIIRMGATYIEHIINDSTHQMKNPIPVSRLADAIKTVGYETVVMSTDSGQVINPRPVEMLESFIFHMLEAGITPEQIETMVKKNPAHMLGIA
jgi:predicted TIM-barrel fold metal-dependent hydrolase